MPAGTDTIYNLAEKGVYNFSCDGTKIEFMSGTSVFMPYTFTDAVSVLGLLTAGTITVTGNLDMTDGHIKNVREIELKDWDSNAGGDDDSVRLLRRGGCWQFYNGGVIIGGYGYGLTPSGIGTGDLHVKGNTHSVGEIRGEADVVAYYTSDKRMKDNIVNISDPLGKLKQIRGVYFDWNEKGPDWTKGWPGQPEGKIHDIGVIAQEVQKVLPEVVIERKGTGMLAVDYQKIVPLLIEGINEQQKHIELLQQRIEKLENK